LHSNDEKIIKSSNFLLMILGSSERVELPLITYVSDGFEQKIGGSILKYIFMPGHTPGSCIIEIGNAWFTGDTLYSYGVGLSKLPSENHEQLKISLLSIWDQLTEKINIYPGHGRHESGLFIKNKNSPLLDFLGINNNQL
jgi:glyoxylase-like metal-dependent hydrolase (beta-lactamase superfamily II)